MTNTIVSADDALVDGEFQSRVSQSHVVEILVRVLQNGTPIAEVPVVSGSVTMESRSAIRGRCDLTLGDLDLLPEEADDLLAPYGNEIQVCRGVRYEDGSSDVVSLGKFRIQEFVADDSGDSLSMSVSGQDRSIRVQEGKFELPGQVAAGTLFTDAILDLVNDVYPSVEYDFASTSITTPLLVYEEGDDRWDFCQGMAEALGAELYFDGDGILRLVPLAVPINPVLELSEGDGGVLVSASRKWTRSDSWNVQIVTGNAIDQEDPPRGEARDTNPSSPTYYLGPYGQVVDFWSSEFITDVTQANDAAAGRLSKNLGTTKSIGFGSIVNPSLQPGKVVTVVRDRLGVNEDHVIDSLTIPLGIEDTMSGDTRVVQVT